MREREECWCIVQIRRHAPHWVEGELDFVKCANSSRSQQMILDPGSRLPPVRRRFPLRSSRLWHFPASRIRHRESAGSPQVLRPTLFLLPSGSLDELPKLTVAWPFARCRSPRRAHKQSPASRLSCRRWHEMPANIAAEARPRSGLPPALPALRQRTLSEQDQPQVLL